MVTMAPGAYGGFPPVQFGPPTHFRDRSRHVGYGRQPGAYPPFYTTQPFYQPPFNAQGPYPADGIGQARQPSMGAQFLLAANRLDGQYRYEQYMRNLAKEQRRYFKQAPRNDMALANYPPYGGAGDWMNTTGQVIQYEQEIRYIPFPIYIQQPSNGFGGSGNLGTGYLPNSGFGNTLASTFHTQTNMNLPPKIRVIFIPTGNSSLQQQYTGPLAMPPFLFNRMQQPLCSFALPPPLPQLGSLPLTAGIQEMVMQRYQNPVAVFPFSSNWQMPQPMISSFSQVPQQQQQSLMPFSNFQPISAAPQSYLPAAPQFYAPPPPLPIPSAPQYSQPYMPPSYAMPSNQPVPYLPQPPMFPGSAAFPPALDYSSNSYAAICRACPPAPPSLGIPVQGHCWVQHCSACHHVPTPMAQPNVRPNGGRVTPLLRYPSVPQYVPDQTMYPQSDPHANAPVMMRPWLRKTPPLPPGAVIVSDHYVSRTPPHQRHQRPPKSYPRQSSRRQRSYTVTTASPVQTSNVPDRNTRIKSPVNQNQNNNNTAKRYEEPARSKSVSSTMSLSSSASAKSADYNKTTIYHSDPKEKVIPKQLAGEARSVNLKYNYQAQDLPSVYLINRYIKSSSEGSSLAPDLPESPVFSEKSHPNAPSPIDSNGAKEEKPRSSPRPPKTAMSKLIIIRESTTRSPSVVSTTSTLSSNAAFSILGKDSDTLSTTSTVKANLSKEEDNIVNEAVF